MSRYEGSYTGIGILMRSDMMRAEMVARGERVLARAIETAPVYRGPDDRHRGRYKASLGLTSTSRGGWRSNRAAAIIRASAPESLIVEFGDSRQRGHHTLRNALTAAGD